MPPAGWIDLSVGRKSRKRATGLREHALTVLEPAALVGGGLAAPPTSPAVGPGMGPDRIQHAVLPPSSTPGAVPLDRYGDFSAGAMAGWAPEYRKSWDERGGLLGFAQREMNRGARRGGAALGRRRVAMAFERSGMPGGDFSHLIPSAPATGLAGEALAFLEPTRRRPRRVVAGGLVAP